MDFDYSTAVVNSCGVSLGSKSGGGSKLLHLEPPSLSAIGQHQRQMTTMTCAPTPPPPVTSYVDFPQFISQSSQHIPLWMTPPVGMERLRHSMAYPHGGMRTAQHGQGQGQDKGQGGPPHPSTPPQGATQVPNSRDGSRMNKVRLGRGIVHVFFRLVFGRRCKVYCSGIIWGKMNLVLRVRLVNDGSDLCREGTVRLACGIVYLICFLCSMSVDLH